MTTLRDVWIAKGMNSTQVAALAGCGIPTLYKLNRRGREERHVAIGTVRRVCAVLGLSLTEYEKLDVCPEAERYRPPRKEEQK